MIELVATLEFGRGGNSEPDIGDGWSVGEDGHRWMVGRSSELWLRHDGPRRDCILELEVHPYLYPPIVSAQPLVAAVGSVQLDEIAVKRPTTLGYFLPAALLSDEGRTLVTLVHQNAVRPADIGSGGDNRLLSLSASVGRLWRLPTTDTGPTTDRVSEAARPSASPELAQVPPSPELVTHFESLGDNREFGMVQRHFVPEQLGLLQFATIDLHSLLRGLRSGFAGIGNVGNLHVIERNDECAVIDRHFGISYRAFVAKDPVESDGFLNQQSSDLKLLAGRLMQDVQSASKIFVLKRNEPLTQAEIWPIFAVLNEHVDNTLLWVVPTTEGCPAGTVERLAHGLLKGYVDSFSPSETPQGASLEAWLELCRNSWLLAHDQMPTTPAIFSTPPASVDRSINGGTDSTVVNIDAIGDFARQAVPGIEFQCLAPPDIALPLPPRFTFGPCPAELPASYYRQFGIGSVGIHQARDVRLSGQFLLSRDGVYFRCPEMNVHEAHIRGELDRLSAAGPAMQEKRLTGQYVVLAGPGNPVYGHWLIEYLPKVGLLDAAGYDVHSLRYLIPSSSQRYVHAWLELLGIRPEQVTVYDADRDVVIADELLIPTVMHNGVRVSPLLRKAATFMLDQVGRNRDLQASPHGQRILLSRGPTSQSRKLFNRAAIEEIATQRGFAVVQPEKLSLLEQVELFHGARAIIGEYGSALHGSLFSPAGTVVCALRGTNLHPGFIQSGIGTSLQQPTGYVFGESAGTDRNSGFHVDEPTFKACMDLVFNPGLL